MAADSSADSVVVTVIVAKVCRDGAVLFCCCFFSGKDLEGFFLSFGVRGTKPGF